MTFHVLKKRPSKPSWQFGLQKLQMSVEVWSRTPHSGSKKLDFSVVNRFRFQLLIWISFKLFRTLMVSNTRRKDVKTTDNNVMEKKRTGHACGKSLAMVLQTHKSTSWASKTENINYRATFLAGKCKFLSLGSKFPNKPHTTVLGANQNALRDKSKLEQENANRTWLICKKNTGENEDHEIGCLTESTHRTQKQLFKW